MFEAVISGIGSYIPERKLTNLDLEKMVDTSDEWILTRTGISERRIASPDEATSDLAFQAALAAMEDASISADEIDLILVATVTPDHQFPAVACQLQEKLGCRTIGAFDLSATCTGFIAALQVAEQYIQTGRHQHILIVGADTLSRFTDYTDRSSCILFADGAGACILSRGKPIEQTQTGSSRPMGILHSAVHTDGRHFHRLYIPGGGSRYPNADTPETKSKIVMEGNKIFKLAVQSMRSAIEEALQATALTVQEINWLIPHQANARILETVAREMNIPMEKVINTIRYLGNNSSATIPIAMDLAVKEGKMNRGDILLLTAFGGGLVWGSVVIRY